MSDTPVGYAHLLGTRWRNKRSGHEYIVTEIRPRDAMVYMVGDTKGSRSTWKYAPQLPFDYEEIKDAVSQ